MSECGGCRHFKPVLRPGQVIGVDTLTDATVIPSDLLNGIGICEREDWGKDIFPTGGVTIHEDYEVFQWRTRSEHHKHILASDHHAPPCYEGRRKRVKCKMGASFSYNGTKGEGFTGYFSLDDIKKGEEVEIV